MFRFQTVRNSPLGQPSLLLASTANRFHIIPTSQPHFRTTTRKYSSCFIKRRWRYLQHSLSHPKHQAFFSHQQIMSFSITFLGTSSGVPTKRRNVSATCLQSPSSASMTLIDCGEGTQHRLQDTSLKSGQIRNIFLTHLHGDHIFGLPGLLCSLSGNNPPDRDFITIVGPIGIRQFLQTSLSFSDSHLAFDLKIKELVPPDMTEEEVQLYEKKLKESSEFLNRTRHLMPSLVENTDEENFSTARKAFDGEFLFFNQDLKAYQIREFQEEGLKQKNVSSPREDNVKVTAAPIAHRVFCVGYVFEENDLPGPLNVKLLISKFGVKPGPFCSQLKNGETVTVKHPKSGEDVVIRPSDVIGDKIPGRKLVLLGDTHDPYEIQHLARDCDFLVHECTLDNLQKDLAIERGHSVPSMAAEFARSVNAKRLILSHFSARFPRSLSDGEDPNTITLDTLKSQAEEIFKTGSVEIAEDFKTFEVKMKK